MDNNILESLRELKELKVDHIGKPKIYEAGPMEFVSEDYGKGWRDTIETELKDDYNVFNPCEEVKLFNELKEIDKNTENGFDFNAIRSQFVGIINTDLYELLTSSIVLCKWDNDIHSAGTPSELTFAKVFGIPVLLINDDIEHVSKWVIGCVTEHRPNFDNVKEIIKNMLEDRYGKGKDEKN